ncbi:MAG: AgmX/PglI C-terminal domain-containing protein [Deltaproteobacteria bacterium]|nr:AgmX/PglI C-terminal domain-containing protein [Deltaproteobacteria bacterium]
MNIMLRALTLSAVILWLASAAAQAPGPLRGLGGAVDPRVPNFEGEVRAALNGLRKPKKLPPLGMDEALRAFARRQAEAGAKGEPAAQKSDEMIKAQNLAPHGYRLQYAFGTKAAAVLRDLKQDNTLTALITEEHVRLGVGVFWVPDDKPYFQVAVLAVREPDPMAGRTGLARAETDPVMQAAASEINKACYEPALVKNPNFGGNLIFQIVIAGAGEVQSAKYLSKSDNAAFDTCALEIVNNLRFPAPYKGKPVTLNHPMHFQPPQGERKVGRLTGDQVTRTFGGASYDFRACFESRLKEAKPGLAGTITLALTVAPDGSVAAIHVQEDTPKDTLLTEGVLARARSLKFPPPEFGAEAKVVFPLRFEAANPPK